MTLMRDEVLQLLARNRDRIRAFNAVNLRLGYPALEIRSPMEIDYE